MQITYREYDPSRDYDSKARLFALSFPETVGTAIATAAHHTWKLSGFPAPVASYQYVACEGNELVGYYAAIPYPYLIDGESRCCGMVCDVMTHPDRRGRGIFTGIGRHATEAMKAQGVAFTSGYPIRPEVIPGHLKVGWQTVAKLPMYFRPLGLRSLLPKTLRPLSRLLDPLLRLAQCWSFSTPRGYRTEMLSRQEFFGRYGGDAGNDYRTFLAQWVSGRSNALLKSPEFLRWRTGAPTAEYHFSLLWHAAELVGMAVVRPTVLKGIQTLAVLDFMVLPAHLAGSRALHLEIRRLADRHRKDAVACMISQRWARAYRFPGSAYLKSPAVFSLIVKKLDDALPDEAVYEEARWHLSWIDSDDL